MSDGVNDGSQASSSKASSGISTKQIVIIVLTVVALVFILMNRDTVETSFLFFEVHTPHWVGMVITLALGGAIGWFLCSRRTTRRDD